MDQRPQLPFNKVDQRLKVSRQSYMGEYKVIEGLPLNPQGRTGLYGRGVLGRWGPNHAGDPVVTRWCKDEKGEVETDGGKRVLEFVAIQREDNMEWAIPGVSLCVWPWPINDLEKTWPAICLFNTWPVIRNSIHDFEKPLLHVRCYCDRKVACPTTAQGRSEISITIGPDSLA